MPKARHHHHIHQLHIPRRKWIWNSFQFFCVCMYYYEWKKIKGKRIENTDKQTWLHLFFCEFILQIARGTTRGSIRILASHQRSGLLRLFLLSCESSDASSVIANSVFSDPRQEIPTVMFPQIVHSFSRQP